MKKIRSLFPRATIVLGGAGVNTVKDLLQLKAFFPEVNALVKGDGEKVFCRLLECLKDGQIDTIKMEALAVKGVYVSVEGREYLDNRANVLSGEELNELPALTAFPDLVKDIKRRGCLELHTSRGCKYRCVFCSHKYHDRPIYWSADRLLQELREIKKKIQRKELPKEARNIYFSDDDFFQDKERAIRFLTLSSADPAIRTFFKYSFQGAIGSFLSRGKVDRQLLGLLKQVKIGWLNLGTDGFSDKMLRLLGKSGYNWRQAKEVMVAVDISGIPHCHYLILTHPQMDEQMFFEQLNNLIIVLSHNPNMRIHVNETITAYEGTILMEKAKQFIPDRLQTLDGVRGERKYLPIHLPLSQDGYLNLAIMKTLRQPFKTVSQLIEDRKAQIKKGADFQKVAKLTAKMIRWRRKQPVGLTVLDAINWEHRFVVFTALRFLLEETARQYADKAQLLD